MKQDLNLVVDTPTRSLKAIIAVSASADGSVATLTGYRGAQINVNVGKWTKGTHTIGLKESDAVGGSYTAVAAGDIIGTVPVILSSATAELGATFGYSGSKEFLKVTTTVTGLATGGAQYTAMVQPSFKINRGKLN